MPRKCVKSTKEVSCSQKYNKESTENINIIIFCEHGSEEIEIKKQPQFDD